MIGSVVKLCIFLFLTAEGVLGSEQTINVRKHASVTLACSSWENLGKCSCPAFPQNCQKCVDLETLVNPDTSYGAENYFKLSRLELSNSGLYACFTTYKVGKKYRLNVTEDQCPNTVIGTVGQSIVISCGTEMDNMAASETHWCRLANGTSCQPDAITGPENEIRGDFKILDSNASFSLEKHQLTPNDTGSYRFTQIFQNETKVYVVKLQVESNTSFLQISSVKQKPYEPFKIKCQYSQDLQEFSKSWRCDGSECPETVTSVDDRFQSALVMTFEHVACSKIKSFTCVAKTPGSSVYSNVYLKPSYKNPIVNVGISSYQRSGIVQVNAYSMLNLICYKSDRNYDYDRWGSRNYHYEDVKTRWCKVAKHFNCYLVKDNLQETTNSVILQICVTPNDDGTTYRCSSGRRNIDVQIAVLARPPPPVKPVPPAEPKTTEKSKVPDVGIIIVVAITIVLIVLIVSVTVRCKSRSEGLFVRRTPLSAVDVHANLYANSLAQYYSQSQVPPPDKHGEGEGTRDKETSSSSDDEFEELPVRPKTSSSVMPEERAYVIVKPRGSTRSGNVNALLRDSEQFGRVKTHTDDEVTKQCKETAQSSSERTNNTEDDDEDEITYTDVFIKPKHRK